MVFSLVIFETELGRMRHDSVAKMYFKNLFWHSYHLPPQSIWCFLATLSCPFLYEFHTFYTSVTHSVS